MVSFPYSNLQSQKRRPALVLAVVARGDIVLCQITSRRFDGPTTVKIAPDDFEVGALINESYVRAEKLFTANDSIIERRVGKLKPATMQKVSQKLGVLFGLQ